MQQDSLFTRIIKGEVPCYKVFEDDQTLAFLDIYPVQPGHVLVIPKQQIEFVWDMPDDLYQHVLGVSKRLALHMREKLAVPYVSARVVGTDVPHAHVHLIPFSSSDQLAAAPRQEPDHTELQKLAQTLAF